MPGKPKTLDLVSSGTYIKHRGTCLYPSSRELKTGGSGVQGHPLVYTESQGHTDKEGNVTKMRGPEFAEDFRWTGRRMTSKQCHPVGDRGELMSAEQVFS